MENALNHTCATNDLVYISNWIYLVSMGLGIFAGKYLLNFSHTSSQNVSTLASEPKPKQTYGDVNRFLSRILFHTPCEEVSFPRPHGGSKYACPEEMSQHRRQDLNKPFSEDESVEILRKAQSRIGISLNEFIDFLNVNFLLKGFQIRILAVNDIGQPLAKTYNKFVLGIAVKTPDCKYPESFAELKDSIVMQVLNIGAMSYDESTIASKNQLIFDSLTTADNF